MGYIDMFQNSAWLTFELLFLPLVIASGMLFLILIFGVYMAAWFLLEFANKTHKIVTKGRSPVKRRAPKARSKAKIA